MDYLLLSWTFKVQGLVRGACDVFKLVVSGMADLWTFAPALGFKPAPLRETVKRRHTHVASTLT